MGKNITVSICAIICFMILIEGFFYFQDKSYRSAENCQILFARDQSYCVPKPKGVYRIILLGGSAAYDTVDDFRKTWAYMLEKKLESKYTSDVEIVNLAYYSETSSDELEDLYLNGKELEPDLVIVFDGFNDVYNLFHYLPHWYVIYSVRADPIKVAERLDGGFRLKLQRFFMRNSYSYKYLNGHYEKIRREESIKAMTEKRESNIKALKEKGLLVKQKEETGDNFFPDESSWDEILTIHNYIYAKNLEKMGKLINSYGAKGLFVFQPDLTVKAVMEGAKLSEKERTQMNIGVSGHLGKWLKIMSVTYPIAFEIMRDTAKKHNIRHVNLNSILNDGDFGDIFDGNVHFTNEGRELISNIFFRLISDIGDEKLGKASNGQK